MSRGPLVLEHEMSIGCCVLNFITYSFAYQFLGGRFGSLLLSSSGSCQTKNDHEAEGKLPSRAFWFRAHKDLEGETLPCCCPKNAPWRVTPAEYPLGDEAPVGG